MRLLDLRLLFLKSYNLRIPFIYFSLFPLTIMSLLFVINVFIIISSILINRFVLLFCNYSIFNFLQYSSLILHYFLIIVIVGYECSYH